VDRCLQTIRVSLVIALCLGAVSGWAGEDLQRKGGVEDMIRLPAPATDSKFDLNKAIQLRRSLREFKDEPLTMGQVGQLLWSAQGVTSLGGYRTVPSAGALYPLEVYVVAGKVDGLPAGVYKYHPQEHSLSKSLEGDKRKDLAAASLEQYWMADAPVMIVLAAVHERTTGKYGERGVRYVDMEVGHAAQNVALEAVAMNLGAVDVGAFSDGAVKKILRLPAQETPLCIVPVGRKK
jgi:SagB-type dehydrogenase family enzyme